MFGNSLLLDVCSPDDGEGTPPAVRSPDDRDGASLPLPEQATTSHW